jgi:hypothetical protein
MDFVASFLAKIVPILNHATGFLSSGLRSGQEKIPLTRVTPWAKLQHPERFEGPGRNLSIQTGQPGRSKWMSVKR